MRIAGLLYIILLSTLLSCQSEPEAIAWTVDGEIHLTSDKTRILSLLESADADISSIDSYRVKRTSDGTPFLEIRAIAEGNQNSYGFILQENESLFELNADCVHICSNNGKDDAWCDMSIYVSCRMHVCKNQKGEICSSRTSVWNVNQ